MTKKILTPGSASEEFSSNDGTMCKTLMSIKHQPVRIEIDNITLTYYFDNSKVCKDVDALARGEDLPCTIHGWWTAERVWQINLHRARSL